MKLQPCDESNAVLETHDTASGFLNPIVEMQAPDAKADTSTIRIGKLVALTRDSQRPLVAVEGQSAALAAMSIVDLKRSHIGKQVVLAVEHGRPIVIGVVRDAGGWPTEPLPTQVNIEADGARLIIDAKNEVVLRCGKASISLTEDGRIVLRGTQIVSDADGANRIRGGSVQLN